VSPPSLAPAEFWTFREASGARRFESKASFVSAKFSTTVPGRIECVRKMLVLADPHAWANTIMHVRAYGPAKMRRAKANARECKAEGQHSNTHIRSFPPRKTALAHVRLTESSSQLVVIDCIGILAIFRVAAATEIAALCLAHPFKDLL
jgi:hypothetical protein